MAGIELRTLGIMINCTTPDAHVTALLSHWWIFGSLGGGGSDDLKDFHAFS